MIVFFDTEFTGFKDPELISIGMVEASSDRYCYFEVTDFNKAKATDFVHEFVLPLTGKAGSALGPKTYVADQVMAWLERYKQTGVTLAYDYDGDLTLLIDLLGGKLPEWIKTLNIWNHINEMVLETFWTESGLSNHHALYDALANRFAYRPQP